MPLSMAMGNFSLMLWASSETPLQSDEYYKTEIPFHLFLTTKLSQRLQNANFPINCVLLHRC